MLVKGGLDLTEPSSSWEPVQAVALEDGLKAPYLAIAITKRGSCAVLATKTLWNILDQARLAV